MRRGGGSANDSAQTDPPFTHVVDQGATLTPLILALPTSLARSLSLSAGLTISVLAPDPNDKCQADFFQPGV
ncbi:hypothetical protein N7468_006310 [Penicillium chermesinum]|uniref:Uncharacterized protein n=1 Tax=Penicillium chermesinum TaxID=63820 RepID=A0A9W9NS27_9EURO|nr:uncharacterized protein N7468_006310 [Penicillium chermesinum]KAJ5225085.1 hypothetical protein N7468_006310 [Penicillium chermesinum]